MTPEQLVAAKSIVQHAAVNSLETDDVMLLGHALQEIDCLRAELDRLSAQGGEVPEIGDKVRATMNRTDWFEGVFKERSEVFAEFGVEVPGIGLRFFIHAEKIPAPPHPDTVEASKLACETCDSRDGCPKRGKACMYHVSQPTTNETRG